MKTLAIFRIRNIEKTVDTQTQRTKVRSDGHRGPVSEVSLAGIKNSEDDPVLLILLHQLPSCTQCRGSNPGLCTCCEGVYLKSTLEDQKGPPETSEKKVQANQDMQRRKGPSTLGSACPQKQRAQVLGIETAPPCTYTQHKNIVTGMRQGSAREEACCYV